MSRSTTRPRTLRDVLVMAAMFVAIQFAFPDLAWDLLSSMIPGGGSIWREGERVTSPDGEFFAVAETLDKGARGWGPRRVVVAAVSDPGDSSTAFLSPSRSWGLVPQWSGPHQLEIVVHTDREPTVQEQANRRDTVRVDWERVEVQIVYREPGME